MVFCYSNPKSLRQYFKLSYSSKPYSSYSLKVWLGLGAPWSPSVFLHTHIHSLPSFTEILLTCNLCKFKVHNIILHTYNCEVIVTVVLVNTSPSSHVFVFTFLFLIVVTVFEIYSLNNLYWLLLSLCLFNLDAEYIMRNAWLDEAQAGIEITWRNINNLRYADDTTLTAEIKEELKSLLKVKEESEKVGLKLNI